MRLLVLLLAAAQAATVPTPARSRDQLDRLFDGLISPASAAPVPGARPPLALSSEDQKLLEDLARRNFRFFRERADKKTGLVLDRAPFDGGKPKESVASVAATGFGLGSLCAAAAQGLVSRREAAGQAKRTLRFALTLPSEHGWLYHFVDSKTGRRAWNSEVSSIDTALFLAGALTARQCFDDPEIKSLATRLYERVDFPWMLNGSPNLLSMGWTPEKGFIPARWDTYSEHMVLDLLAIGSPTYPIPASEWDAWARPQRLYEGYSFVAGTGSLFIHQYSQAFVDFRGKCDRHGIDYFDNSVKATMAQRAYLRDLAQDPSGKYAGYSSNIWGVTASDMCGGRGYSDWGAPPLEGPVDGTVVPSAPGGSLMLTPRESLDALAEMKKRFPKTYGRYGFTDSFHPVTGCVNADVLGIDQGITMLSAANLKDGAVWSAFMKNPEIAKAMDAVGFGSCGGIK